MKFHGVTQLMTRSLRVDTRSVLPYVLRIVMVLVVLLGVFSAQESSRFYSAPGLILFGWMAWINFFLISVGAIGMFSACITEEKEQMTLGLLMMTDMSPLALLLGKVMGQLLTAMLLLLIQLPFALLCITLGGVSADQIIYCYIALFAFLLLVCAMATLASVMMSRTSGASGTTFSALLIYLASPLIVYVLVEIIDEIPGYTNSHPLIVQLNVFKDLLYESSIFSSLMQTAMGAVTYSSIRFQVHAHLIAAGILFVLSWLSFNFFNANEKPAAPPRLTVLPKKKGKGKNKSRKHKPVWSNAILWKDFVFIGGGWRAFILKHMLYCLVVAMTAFFVVVSENRNYQPDFRETITTIWMIITGIGFLIELAVLSGRIFHEEIKWQTWPALMVLPRNLKGIVFSKCAGCAMALLPALTHFFVASFIHPDFWHHFTSELLSDSDALVWFAFFICWGLLAAHLITYLSLWLKHGSVPAGIVVSFAALMSMGIVDTVMGDDEAAAFVTCVFMVLAMVAIWFHGKERLLELAAKS